MSKQKLIEKLKNSEYRHAFSSAQSRRTISAQIKALRNSEGRNWTQKNLGDRAGMKQNAIARLENPSYGDYSIRTLQRLAEAFDVGLVVRFAPFSELVNTNQTANSARFTPASFVHDIGLSQTHAITPEWKFSPQEVFQLVPFRPQVASETINKSKTIGPLSISVEPAIQPLYQSARSTGGIREIY